jgi:hypothetical protein
VDVARSYQGVNAYDNENRNQNGNTFHPINPRFPLDVRRTKVLEKTKAKCNDSRKAQ